MANATTLETDLEIEERSGLQLKRASSAEADAALEYGEPSLKKNEISNDVRSANRADGYRADGYRADGEIGERPQHLVRCYEDRALVNRCVQGEVGAWEELYAVYRVPLSSLVRFLLGAKSVDSSLVDEITSRVWLSLISQDGALLDRYDPSRSARLITYLRLIARDEIKRYFRSELRRRRRDEVAGCRARPEEVSDALLHTNLTEFSHELTPRELEFFEQSLLNLPKEALEERDISDANVWQLRHRIRTKLLRFLSEE